MKKREVFNVDENRLKEIIANDTSADGTPNTSKAEELLEVPQTEEAPQKSTVAPRKANRTPVATMDKAEKYDAMFLSRKESVHRKQTYISYETYRKLARILPLLSDSMTVPAFLDNVLDNHLKQYEEELGELIHRNTQNTL